MSNINTSGLDTGYPVPGVNNDSQGFRTNFATINTNLIVAGTELTDLQNKVIVKSALTGTVVDNDMGGTLIKNALTRGFRASTFNLGSSLSGVVRIDVSNGDVQYGTIAADTTLQFDGWAPLGTRSNVELQLTVANSSASLNFPAELNTNSYGAFTLENQTESANIVSVTAPFGVTQLDYRFSTLDCGNTIVVEPYNRPRRSSEIVQRIPASTGYMGDKTGTVTAGLSRSATTCTATTITTNLITCVDSSVLTLDDPITFSGNLFGNAITAGTTYYVRSTPSISTFTISATPGTNAGPAAAIALNTTSGSMTVTPTSYMYVATNDYDATEVGPFTPVSANIGNTIALPSGNASTLTLNAPIVFSGEQFGEITPNQIYYISNISGDTIKVSASRYNGIAGQQVNIAANVAAVGTTCTSLVGSSIWKRLPLQTW